MTNRYINVSSHDNSFVISCYDGHHNDPIHSWPTDRLEAIPVIARLWIEHSRKEEYLEQVLNGIL